MLKKVTKKSVLSLFLSIALVLGLFTGFNVNAQNTYTIVFDGNGATSGTMEKYTNVSSFVVPECAYSKEGYVFEGWYVEDYYSSWPIRPGTNMSELTLFSLPNVNGVITFKAKWISADQEYSISQYSKTPDGEMVDVGTLNFKAGDIVTIPACDYKIEGQKFVGWSRSSNDDSYLLTPGETYLGQDLYSSYGGILVKALYAVWVGDDDSTRFLKLYSNSSEATGSMNPIEFKASDVAVTIPECGFTRDGCTFGGWTFGPDSHYPILYPGEKHSGQALIDYCNQYDSDGLYAIWNGAVTKRYIVFFDGNGATTGDINPVSVRRDGEFVVPECEYIKYGYKFDYWYSEKQSELQMTPGTRIAGNVIGMLADSDDAVYLKAHWTPKSPEEGNVVSFDEDTWTAVVNNAYTGGQDTVDLDIIESSNIYRMYNPATAEHLYTKNYGEVEWLEGLGWNHETESDYAVVDARDDDAIPVYRLYNPYADTHHYTESVDEVRYDVSVGWIYERISHYVYDKDSNRGTPQWRLYEASGAHNWTSDKGEIRWLESMGWINEGIRWRVL